MLGYMVSQDPNPRAWWGGGGALLISPSVPPMEERADTRAQLRGGPRVLEVSSCNVRDGQLCSIVGETEEPLHSDLLLWSP